MKQRLAMIAAGAGRAVRGLWPDRDPLRRTLDRVEAAIVVGLAVAFLAGAPAAAVTAARLAATIGTSTAQTQRSWHRMPAVLLADASRRAGPRIGRWPGPAGLAPAGVPSPPRYPLKLYLDRRDYPV
jgi:hypothetical protein